MVHKSFFDTCTKSVLAALALIITCLPADAANYDANDVGTGFLQQPFYSNTTMVAPGPFSDLYGFNIAANSAFSGAATSLHLTSIFGIDPTTFQLTLTGPSYPGIVFGPAGPVPPGGGAFAVSTGQLPLTPGAYSLMVSGTANGTSGGLYNLTMAAAIPEPSTYALMLAGLGLVGFVASRRRKSQADVADSA